MSKPVADEDGEPVAAQPGRREPVFNLPLVVLLLMGVCVGVHMIRFFHLTVEQDVELIVRAAFIPARYSGAYAIDLYALTSPVTYAFLHGSLVHLAINMVWLAAFGSPLANRLGSARFVLFWIFTSLAAVLLHYLIHPSDHSPLVGASGAISGMMGAAARFGFRTDRLAQKSVFNGPLLPIAAALTSRFVVAFLAVWLVINLIAGLGFMAPEQGIRIAWEAHIGGFLAGFFGIALFDRGRREPVA
jgi:membrane associated rhomboid family serine protease